MCVFSLFICGGPRGGRGVGLALGGIPLVFVIALLCLLVCALTLPQKLSCAGEQSRRSVCRRLKDGGQRSGGRLLPALKDSPGSTGLPRVISRSYLESQTYSCTSPRACTLVFMDKVVSTVSINFYVPRPRSSPQRLSLLRLGISLSERNPCRLPCLFELLSDCFRITIFLWPCRGDGTQEKERRCFVHAL